MLRIFATSPMLPSKPFSSVDWWGAWVSTIVDRCLVHGSAFNLIVLPELTTLPVLITGKDWPSRMARRYIHKPNLAMIVASHGRALKYGLGGVVMAQATKLNQSLDQLQSIARTRNCFLLAGGLTACHKTHRVVNRSWVIGRSGIIHTYDKQHLTEAEQQNGIAAGPHPDPFFALHGHKLATVTCLDMFNSKIQRKLQLSDAEAILVPSANPQLWASHAASGEWQPCEWLRASDWIMDSSTLHLFVNSMLRGKFSTICFDGQPFIRGRFGNHPGGFPSSSTWAAPNTGFYPAIKEDIVYADLSA